MDKKQHNSQLTVVVPAYNAGTWLKRSIPATILAIEKTRLKDVEILVIDDGSTDNTVDSIKDIPSKFPIKVISQKNSGRFVARENGTNNAKYDLILFIDSRIIIGEDSLKYALEKTNLADPSSRVWNSHVYINKDSIYARFWEAITFNVWRKYFINPRHISYGLKDFDKYPKGTTCMLVSKSVMKQANKWFRTQTRDLKTSNDDTLLLRGIAKTDNINIGPKYYCSYNSRTSLRQFTRHVYHRGKVFVDGFLRNDGNAYFYLLILFLVGSFLALPVLILLPKLIVPVFICLIAVWLLMPIAMIARRTHLFDALSFFILLPIFVIFYGSGIWVMFIKQTISKKNNVIDGVTNEN